MHLIKSLSPKSKYIYSFVLGLLVIYTLPLKPTFTIVEAALRDETRVINTLNLSDSEVHTYYTGFVTEGMSGHTLKVALNDRIKNHTVVTPYAETKYAMAIVDRDYELSPLANNTSYNFTQTSTENPYLRLIYAQYNHTASAVRWNEDHVTIWNKEHTWAKSLGNFGETAPAGTDLHHLIASDQNNNNYHSNYDFGNLTTVLTNVIDERGFTSGKVGYSSLSPTRRVYEPPEEYKGDVARMIFYMATRYITYSSTGNPMLRIIDGLAGGVSVTSSSSVYGELGILSDYLQWNLDDPVDAYEIKRNNLIYNNFQGNRNPYIDHPEWANIVFDPTYSGSGATITSQSSSVGTDPAWQTFGATLSSISVDATSALTSYATNEPFSSSGLIVTATMSDSSTKTVQNFTTDYDGVVSFDALGNQLVTVSYTEGEITETATYTITVDNKLLTGIELDTSALTLTVPFGSTYNDQSLLVEAQYSDNTVRSIPESQYSKSSANTHLLGTQLMTVTYGPFTESYSFFVTFDQADFALADDLFFSEYLEGSSNNKVIEIYNGTDDIVSLEDYQVKLYANGASTATNTLNLTGSLPRGEVLVIYNSSVSGAVLTAVNNAPYKVASAVANFNGDDALELLRDEIVIDVFGTVGFDPGTAWTGTDRNGTTLSTLDRTLIRAPNVFKGNTTFNFTGQFTEWTVFPVDTATYIGSHSFTVGNPKTFAEAYADYFLRTTAPFCETLEGDNSPWSELSQEYGYLPSEMKQYVAISNDQPIVDARERYQFLINKYSVLYANNFLVNGQNTPVFATRGVVGFMMAVEEDHAWIIIMSAFIGFVSLIIKKRNSNKSFH
jgi:endonuclease I